MSGYEGSCPSCGATVVFHLGSTLLRVCDHCGVAVARKGADLANYGKVASLIPTPSLLRLGLRGDYEGAPPFTLVGRLQVDHGAGTWDEWLMAFDDGSWAWLSEAQGRFHYMAQAPLPPVPAFDAVSPGDAVDLGPAGVFVATDVRRARFVSAEGELPFAVPPGSTLRYADLSGRGGQFATLDYGEGQAAEAVYVGREVTLPELGFKDLPDAEARRKRASGESLNCTQCGGPLELRVPEKAQRVACAYCGSLLDAQKDFAVLDTLQGGAAALIKPDIPLGSKGRLRDVTWTVIGFMIRSTKVEGIRYAWREFLLYEERHGFRWLVESNGHWSFVEPIDAGAVDERIGTAVYDGTEFKHFQGGDATVDHVLGEFYWAVARGDRVQTEDYVAPPRMLSQEKDDKELVWSLGHYVTAAEVGAAFGREIPEPHGVGPHQPWPLAEQAQAIKRAALVMMGVVVFVYLALSLTGGRKVLTETVRLPESMSPENAAFLGPFIVDRGGNLEVQVKAPVSNSWLYLDGALINEENGEVSEFDVEVAYYAGADVDGTWTEGSTSESRFIPRVSPGRYVLRLAPQWEPNRSPGTYEVVARSRVPRFYQLLLALLAIGAWPLVVLMRKVSFESQRWAESDHPWSSSGDDDEE